MKVESKQFIFWFICSKKVSPTYQTKANDNIISKANDSLLAKQPTLPNPLKPWGLSVSARLDCAHRMTTRLVDPAKKNFLMFMVADCDFYVM